MEQILTNPVFVLFAVLFLGMVLGNISVKGIAFGSSGVLFVALAAGHFGLKVPDGVTGIGTALFVYCVGLGVGNRFFASLRSKGSRLVLLALLISLAGAATAWLLCSVFGINPALAAGLFAGANTSTPALAAAMENVQDIPGGESLINIGYGVAYPFGVIGIVLFVQLLPRLLKKNLDEVPEGDNGKDPQQIITRPVRVNNPEVSGLRMADFAEQRQMKCQITRVLKDDVLMPPAAEDSFQMGDVVMLVGERQHIVHDAGLLGHISKLTPIPRAYGDESAELILLDSAFCHKTLSELHLLESHGITVTRINRLGNTFVPTGDTELIRNDVLRVVGTPAAIRAFSAACGHRSSAIGITDLLSLAGGVALGILVGNIHISLGSEGADFSLGMAGGPLLVALILGHFGKIGPIQGYMPRPGRVLVMELALMLFLAGAGVAGGEKLLETLVQEGISLFLIGVGITMVPLIIGYILAAKIMKMPLAEALGAICGSSTSTPALGAITAKTDRQEPVIAYATAYPAALIIMTALAKLLIELL